MKDYYYTGIGARRTPKEVLEVFEKIGRKLAEEGFILRSGACEGADKAFEAGCDSVGGKKEIYLPWKGYNEHQSELYTINPEATRIASNLYPNWEDVSEDEIKYLSRDVCQVLGQTLDKPSLIVICWTPKGELVGGTSMAMRVAMSNDIEAINVTSSDMTDDFVDEICDYIVFSAKCVELKSTLGTPDWSDDLCNKVFQELNW